MFNMCNDFNILTVERTTSFFWATGLQNVDGSLFGIFHSLMLWYFTLRILSYFCWLLFSFTMVALIFREFWFLIWLVCVCWKICFLLHIVWFLLYFSVNISRAVELFISRFLCCLFFFLMLVLLFDEVLFDDKVSAFLEECESSPSSVGYRVSYRLLQTTFCDFVLHRFLLKLPKIQLKFLLYCFSMGFLVIKTHYAREANLCFSNGIFSRVSITVDFRDWLSKYIKLFFHE